jgi:flagellar motor switch protein FliN/FliY
MADDEKEPLTNTNDAQPADASSEVEGAGPQDPGAPAPESSASPAASDATGEEAQPDSDSTSVDAFAAQMGQAIEEETASDSLPEDAAPMDVPDLDGMRAPTGSSAGLDIDLLSDVELNVKIELGRSRMTVDEVLKLGEGSVVELDKLAGDPVDVFVNDRLVARGEVLVLNDNFCVRINEIIEGTMAAVS